MRRAPPSRVGQSWRPGFVAVCNRNFVCVASAMRAPLLPALLARRAIRRRAFCLSLAKGRRPEALTRRVGRGSIGPRESRPTLSGGPPQGPRCRRTKGVPTAAFSPRHSLASTALTLHHSHHHMHQHRGRWSAEDWRVFFHEACRAPGPCWPR
jgi:hypothetical protein